MRIHYQATDCIPLLFFVYCSRHRKLSSFCCTLTGLIHLQVRLVACVLIECQFSSPLYIAGGEIDIKNMKGRNYAIVVAAGQGKRMGTDVSKQYLLLDDKPVVVHALRAFDEQPAIEAIVLVVAPSDVKRVKDSIVSEYEFKKPVLVVEGGQERQQSVYNGLKALGEFGDVDIVVIHDGVRPFVTEQMIRDSILAADRYGAAVVGVPVKDTIKKVDDEQFVICTPKRSQLWLVQTPQAFKYRLIWEAHEKAVQDGFCGTDDAVLVERLGHPVKMVMGSYCNIKITTREDLILAREFMAGGLVYEDRHGL